MKNYSFYTNRSDLIIEKKETSDYFIDTKIMVKETKDNTYDYRTILFNNLNEVDEDITRDKINKIFV